MGDEAPRPECDLVMKGGVTSGVVYPSAILKLHDKRYRFRNIGGASAGAIAASATAAAQLGEASGGFERFRKLNEELSAEGLFLRLFQPSEDTRPLFDIALRIYAKLGARTPEGDGPGLARTILLGLHQLHATARTKYGPVYERGEAGGGRWGALSGGALGLIVAGIALLCCAVATRAFPVAALAPALVTALLFCAASWVLGRRIGGMLSVARSFALGDAPADNFFGLCLGHSDDPGAPQLTDWLHEHLNTLAGKPLDVPLTFADLYGPDEKKRAIDLSMLTTDLSYGEPYMLPFDMREFLFNEEEMRRLFPKVVVDYLLKKNDEKRKHQSEKDNEIEDRYPPGYHRMCTGADMPVLVATRMALSFPMLLSAVPLYLLKGDAAHKLDHDPTYVSNAAEDLELHWFSDGGISSNFPIHFFDRWLPGRPTFGIKLTSTDDDSAMPCMPEARDEKGMRPSWGTIKGMIGFLWAIVGTAMEYRDNMQSVLPSYRERIVRVPLTSWEGGLNLEMEPGIVNRLKDKGSAAGDRIMEFDFMQHKWVRFRVLTDHLERELLQLAEVFADGPGYEAVIDEQARVFEAAGKDESRKWYRPEKPAWCKEAKRRTAALMQAVDVWRQAAPAGHDERERFFEHRPPRPPSALRITPRL